MFERCYCLDEVFKLTFRPARLTSHVQSITSDA
jgi:hypothetical protein